MKWMSSDFLEKARAQTGLADFGEDSFREGLEILLGALDSEARLNTIGEQLISGRVIGHLSQRLQIEDWYRRHPEIDEQHIEQPLIGLSLPRTGSTALSFLLACDPAARSLYREEAAEPCPPPAVRDQQRSDAAAATEALHNSTGLKPHVPSGERAPAECQDLMALDFRSHIFQAFAQIPAYSRWLLDADLESTYAYQRRALKVLQWRLPKQRWRLKCPTHLLFLKDLDKAFPDARYVMTHRDPTDVMASVVDVYVDIVSKFTEHTDLGYLVEMNIEHWSAGMDRTLAFRRQHGDERFFDIDFRDMRRRQIETVSDLYAWLDEPLSKQFALNMKAWWQQNENSREPGGRRNPSDFGIDSEKLRPLFAEYCSRFIKPEAN